MQPARAPAVTDPNAFMVTSLQVRALSNPVQRIFDVRFNASLQICAAIGGNGFRGTAPEGSCWGGQADSWPDD